MAKVYVNDSEYKVTRDKRSVSVNKNSYTIDIHQLDEHHYHLICDNKSYQIEVVEYKKEEETITFKINGKLFTSHLISTIEQTLQQMVSSGNLKKSQQTLISPMPGMIQKIQCEEGQEIKKGDQLIVLNAMKMENVIKASDDGIVSKILINEGEQVEKGKVLIQF